MSSSTSQRIKVDPKVKEVLNLLGVGTFLAASVIFPVLPVIVAKGVKEYEKSQWQKTRKEWGKYNLWRLRQTIKRMESSRLVEIKEEKGIQVVKITEKGRRRLLSYNIEEMRLNDRIWDGKWRLIIYDINTGKKANAETFRRALKKLRLLKVQKSVYLTPFECEKEIEYLRQVYEIGEEVLILKVGSLENEFAYREYFGI